MATDLQRAVDRLDEGGAQLGGELVRGLLERRDGAADAGEEGAARVRVHARGDEGLDLGVGADLEREEERGERWGGACEAARVGRPVRAASGTSACSFFHSLGGASWIASTISVAASVRLCFHGAVAARASPMSSTNALRYSRTIARSIVCIGRDGGEMVVRWWRGERWRWR